jgi:hypothetical protein
MANTNWWKPGRKVHQFRLEPSPHLLILSTWELMKPERTRDGFSMPPIRQTLTNTPLQDRRVGRALGPLIALSDASCVTEVADLLGTALG